MNEQVSSWWSAVEGLEAAKERLQRVVIENEDATKLIRREDGEQTLFYVDPPYVQRTRVVANAYQHEMSESDHIELLEALETMSGSFILSGYRDPIYDDSARRNSWRRVDIKIDNKASSKKTKPMKIESIWMNF
tara:strand:+ start:24 stop:425 length:402 start_codon:yes stop_codon:yes gene_type:complete